MENKEEDMIVIRPVGFFLFLCNINKYINRAIEGEGQNAGDPLKCHVRTAIANVYNSLSKGDCAISDTSYCVS